MAFVKKTWKDRISQYPNRRTITDENGVTKPVTVGRDEGEVTQEGDAFSASNMNDLEVRIESAFASGGGGGGGGGHTILDDSGTALPQRAGLQFKGAYSEDNSTDGVTEVNIVRNMTKAEFDLLPDNKKKGIINVTDITSGSDDRFQPVIYSTEEREIGVWTDGRPVYAIVLTTSVAKSITTSRWTRMEFTTPIPTNIKEMVRMSFACNTQPNFYEGFRLSWDINEHYFKMSCEHNGTFPANTAIYIEYTKTTDAAGSGTWTPQGVPAVHYSTDEQVVGTWIDGSTLYEKTLEISDISSNTTVNVPHGVTGLANIVSYSGYATYAGTAIIPIPYTRSSSYIILNTWDSTNVTMEKANLSSSATNIKLTIRYTKSS